jgi:purine-nucleoside phosphorylase
VTPEIQQALAAIRARAPGSTPRVGLVLGSGLGAFAAEVAAATSIDYAELPGFPPPGVAGHAGRLVLGEVSGTPVAVLAGRAHYYEHGRADAMAVPVRALAALGCEALILTNAAGSLRPDMPPGSVMLITDHINFTGVSPLFGLRSDDRFVDMSAAYDPALCARFRNAAAATGLLLHQGVYVWFAGPNFETPAEVRAAARLGGDAVGMSTVPEVILARHAGLKVAALSIITNLGTGLSSTPLSHAQTMAAANEAAGRVCRLLSSVLAQYKA